MTKRRLELGGLYGHCVKFDFSCLLSGNCGEFNFVNTSCDVKGRLSAAVDFWKSTLNASECVVDIITVGFLSCDIRPLVFG